MYRQSEKNLLNSDTSSTCPHNMVNFSILTAEICWQVWGTPANFNGFRFLAALLHSTLVVGVSQTAALNRGHHLYSAGQPSLWALAHILVENVASLSNTNILYFVDVDFSDFLFFPVLVLIGIVKYCALSSLC